MADDMGSLLEYLQMRQVDRRCAIGLDLAMRCPDRTRGLVAISANYDVEGLIGSGESQLSSVTEVSRAPLR
jgi:hypothetical protein